jgi:hypothetical protein
MSCIVLRSNLTLVDFMDNSKEKMSDCNENQSKHYFKHNFIMFTPYKWDGIIILPRLLQHYLKYFEFCQKKSVNAGVLH